MPLYIAAFLQNIPLWYAIEKLFMVGIGFNTASIGLMVAIMSIVMLIVETPSGILADRWSRKGVMVLGCISLLVCAIVGALSYSEPVYIISTIFWGIYAALYSGTYDAVIYDTAMEVQGKSGNFEKYLGRFRAVEGTAAVAGALSGGLIATSLNMRDTYFFSIPFILVALFFIWKFKEPQLHKAEVAEPVFKHIRQTFAAVLRKPVLLPVVVAIVGFGAVLEILLELSQVWFIAVDTPLALYGVLTAALYSTWTIGGLLAPKFHSKFATSSLMVIMIAAIALLITARSIALVAAAQVIAAVCFVILGVILVKKMHDELPSRLRAGSSSVISTLARTLLIPGSLLITGVANAYSIFTATYILLGVVIVASVAFLSINVLKKQEPASS